MWATDTNLLVRYYTRDDESQTRRAPECLRPCTLLCAGQRRIGCWETAALSATINHRRNRSIGQFHPTLLLLFARWRLHNPVIQRRQSAVVMHRRRQQLINGFDAHWSPLWDGGHVKFWSETSIRTLLIAAGFDAIAIKRVGRLPPLAKSMLVTAQRQIANASVELGR